MVVLNVSDAIKLEIGENDDNNGTAGQAAAAAERKQRVRGREREKESMRWLERKTALGSGWVLGVL